jgi:hypothetical protein
MYLFALRPIKKFETFGKVFMLYSEVVFPMTSRLHPPFTALSLTLCPMSLPPSHSLSHPSTIPSCNVNPEAEFLDVIWAKVLRVFLLAIHNHLY